MLVGTILSDRASNQALHNLIVSYNRGGCSQVTKILEMLLLLAERKPKCSAKQIFVQNLEINWDSIATNKLS